MLWLFSIALIVPIPFAAILTMWWLARTYAARKRENAMVRTELETRNMFAVGNYFGSGQ